MRQFPIFSSIIIVILLASIIAVFSHIMATFDEQRINQPLALALPVEPVIIEKNAIRVSAEFRFSSKPKSIILKDLNDKVVYRESNFDSDNEHETDITIPHDDIKLSQLKLAVEWENEADPYNFFSMEFYGHERAKFGAGAATNIDENIFLQW